MENLLKKLQDEAGLTSDQALKAVSVVKDFMDKEGFDIDWDKFFKGKYDDFKVQAKDAYANMAKQADVYTDKISDVAEDLAEKAKKTAHNLSDKISDFFDGKDTK